MRYVQTIPPDPSLKAVDVAKLAKQCFVTDQEEFSYLEDLLALAVEFVEQDQNVQLLAATWQCNLDAFPNEISLERLPVTAITQIQYTDTNGNSQILDPSQYQVDNLAPNQPARIQPAYGLVWPVTRGYSRTWPTIEANHLGELPEITGFYNAVQVTFTAGFAAFGAGTIPAKLLHAIKMLVATWFRDREDSTVGLTNMPIPLGVTRLLALSDWGQYA
jgi:hypothetical protein